MWFDTLRKKVISELFLAPSVVLPIVGGASAWLLSWATGGIDAMNLVGLVGVMGGLGWMGTRIVFQLDKITANVAAKQQAEALAAQENRLAEILKKLRYDRDPRTDDYLTLLRSAKADFERLAEKPELIVRSLELRSKVNRLFWAAVEQLERSYESFELSEKLYGEQRTEVLSKREVLLADVKQTLLQLQHAVDQMRKINDRQTGEDLSALRDELDESLKIAAKTEERLRELDAQKDYSEYLRE